MNADDTDRKSKPFTAEDAKGAKEEWRVFKRCSESGHDGVDIAIFFDVAPLTLRDDLHHATRKPRVPGAPGLRRKE